MQAVATELQELEAKAALHSLLAQAFNYPDETLVKALASGKFVEGLAKSLEALGQAVPVGLLTTCKKEYMARTAKDRQNILLELEKDYTRMFFASKPRLAYLFESVYREGKLMQDSTFQIARFYADAGLKLTEDFRLPPDHIAVELEFLSFLVFKEIEGARKDDIDQVAYAQELQGLVVDQHLRPFALNISERVGQHARTTFYRTVALILKDCYA